MSTYVVAVLSTYVYFSMMALGKNVRAAREARGWTLAELSERSGVDVGTISALENRDSKRSQFAAPLAHALGVSVEELTGDEAAPLNISESDADYVTIKAGTLRVQAGISGFGIDVENKPDKPIIFRRDWLQKRGYSPASLLAVKVVGRSMEPTLYEDDTVVLDTSATEPRDGDVYVLNCGGEVVVKRLMRRSGVWWMHSDNDNDKRYPPVQCDDGCAILGRVIHRMSETL